MSSSLLRRASAAGVRGLACASLAVVGLTLDTTAAAAAPPSDGPGYMVTVGDSAISGEAGRWAGNTNSWSSRIDALGSGAYNDNATGTAEAIKNCHRSKSAIAHIGTIPSINLSCSGARTYSHFSSGGDWKPGIDFYSDSDGRKGQALALKEFASTNKVSSVSLLIGANNYGFAFLVERCVTRFLLSPSWWPNYCHDDTDVVSRFTPEAINDRTNEVAGAILNLRQAMTEAGYADADYSIIVQTYVSPVPRGSGIRYQQSGYRRQSIGGCGLWNRDADWANDTAVVAMNSSLTEGAARTGLSNVRVMQLANAFDGHRLCERGVGLLEETGISTWRSTGASDKAEWVNQIRTVTTLVGPYQLQESIHPNYWGQLALRNCLRQAFNNGAALSGTCRPGTGVNSSGEPNMTYG